MEQYISKSALVAEIERIRRIEVTNNDVVYNGALDEIRYYIDTIGVKEVDLELNSFDATVCKICNTYLKEMDKDAIVKALEPYKDGDKVKVIIKAQKGK